MQTVICAEDLFFEVGRNLRKETGHRELDAWLVFNLFGLCQSRRFDASGLSPSIGVTNRESCLSLSKVADSKRDRSDVGHLDLSAAQRWPMGLDVSVRPGWTPAWACWGSQEPPDTFSCSLLLRPADLGFKFRSLTWCSRLSMTVTA